MKLYASIYIGTYETVLKVFQITVDKTLKTIDCLRMPVEILTEIKATGYLSKETTNRLCDILGDMKRTIDTYGVTEYQACATVVLRSAINEFFVLEQCKLRTGLTVVVRSNSEQRFLSYRAVASQESFDDMVSESAVIVDVGGASVQMTLFVNGKVKTTQHIAMGTVMLRDQLKMFSYANNRREQLMEMMYKELDVFCTMYLKDVKLQYLIILGDRIASVAQGGKQVGGGVLVKAEKYSDYLQKMSGKAIRDLPKEISNFSENEDLIEPYILLHQAIAGKLPSKYVFFSGVALNEGMAYHYFAPENRLAVNHDFDKDILTAAWAIAKRYGSYQPHLKALVSISVQIFDVMKKYHGMGKRERLLMEVVAILHDCGKYISISEASDCSYTIIMSSEILGLSHQERKMVATIVSMNRGRLLSYEELSEGFHKEEYITMVKLLAILRVANALDRSHKQKFKNIKMALRKDKLTITMESKVSIALEKGMFEEKADFFEHIFSIRPVLKEHRIFE